LKQEILQELKRRKQAIILLAPGVLERCLEKDDFFRFEIESALKYADKLYFLIFGTENLDSIFGGIKGSFFQKLKDVIDSTLVYFVSMDKNFDECMQNLANKIKNFA